jgi:hypothetical protein
LHTEREFNQAKEEIFLLKKRLEKANSDILKLKECIDQKMIEH